MEDAQEYVRIDAGYDETRKPCIRIEFEDHHKTFYLNWLSIFRLADQLAAMEHDRVSNTLPDY